MKKREIRELGTDISVLYRVKKETWPSDRKGVIRRIFDRGDITEGVVQKISASGTWVYIDYTWRRSRVIIETVEG